MSAKEASCNKTVSIDNWNVTLRKNQEITKKILQTLQEDDVVLDNETLDEAERLCGEMIDIIQWKDPMSFFYRSCIEMKRDNLTKALIYIQLAIASVEKKLHSRPVPFGKEFEDNLLRTFHPKLGDVYMKMGMYMKQLEYYAPNWEKAVESWKKSISFGDDIVSQLRIKQANEHRHVISQVIKRNLSLDALMSLFWNLFIFDFDAAEEIVVGQLDMETRPKNTNKKISFWTVMLGRVYEARTGFGWKWRRDSITSRDEGMKNACKRAVEWAEETIRVATENVNERDELGRSRILSLLYEQCGRMLYNTGNYDKALKTLDRPLRDIELADPRGWLVPG